MTNVVEHQVIRDRVTVSMMDFPKRLLVPAALLCLLVGCSGGSGQFTSGGGNTAPVSLLMTDVTTTSGISVLSFEATLSSAVLNSSGVLNAGNRQLLSTPVTVEVTRLQTEIALLNIADVVSGTYTSVDLTFASPSLTFQNDTGAPVTIWGATPACLAGQICTISPTLPANVKLTGTVNLPGPGVTLATGKPAALLLDLNLSTLALNTVQADLPRNSSVAQIVPADPTLPFAQLEDVVGTVSAKDAVHNSFTLHTGIASYIVNIVGGTIPTEFHNFPTTGCTFACLQVGQIVSVNMSLQPDVTLQASDILFEDADSTRAEIEGIVVATTGVVAPIQFKLVVLQETPSVSGIAIGSVVDVAPQTAPPTIFDVDNLGADTTAYAFQGIQHVFVGQELQIRRLSTSTSTLINTDRVRLRSSRLPGAVSQVASPFFFVDNLPPLFATGGVSLLQVKTDPLFTEFGGTAANFTQIVVFRPITIRAQLFPNGSTVGPTAAAVATKVIQH